jgi:energy-coupling factor transporter ATP-binding protein EcfA2
MTTTGTDIAGEYAFRLPPTRNQTFLAEGFGPFVVQRATLIQYILSRANPRSSVHINGCRGSGKTTLLKQLGQALQSQGKTVLFFESAEGFKRESVRSYVRALVRSTQEVYILVDETQSNVNSELFTLLLKNPEGHQVTTIGAGVPEFQTFKYKIGTDSLFLNSLQDLQTEGVLEYFTRHETGTAATAAAEINVLLEYIRSYVGGHIYPFMWLAERLVPRITRDGETVNQVITFFGSSTFRQQEDFKLMTERILPPVEATDLRPLLYKIPNDKALYDLRRKGICDNDNHIISQLLFESILLALRPSLHFPTQLNAGIDGIRQLFAFALPSLNWAEYDAHGGPIEDALTFEMLIILAGVQHLGTRLFNPKLINAGTAGRKPDLYLNTAIDCYVECVLTTAGNQSERKKLDEHISRFYWKQYPDPLQRVAPAYYQIGGSEFAILNYQDFGTVPLQPLDQFFQGQIFSERVFTFLMKTKELYLGHNLLARGT